jgi:di/tricarboxylate transporter
MFTIFFLFLYFLCEILKYRRIDTIKARSEVKGRLYNERIVFLKIIVLGIDVVLYIIIFFTSIVEKSSGLKGFLITLIPYVLFVLVSVRDIRKVIRGHNEEILKGARNPEE